MTPESDRQFAWGNGKKQFGGDVLVIASGKGGVGKTNLALNLGIILARRGQRAVLLDADFGLANADILLNVSPLADFDDLRDPTRDVEELLVRGPGGLRLICAASSLAHDRRRVGWDPEMCRLALQRLRGCCDTLLVDCGAGLNPSISAMTRTGGKLILVTTPEPTALADGYAVLKMLAADGFDGAVGVVVNMARHGGEGQQVGARLARVADSFLGLSVAYLGWIPVDRHVPQAVRARVPVVERYRRCPASLCFHRICDRIAPEGVPAVAGNGIWSRVAGLFL